MHSIDYYRLPDVLKKTGMGRSSLYAAIAKGLFPPPRKIGSRSVAWRHDELDAWANSRPISDSFNLPNQ